MIGDTPTISRASYGTSTYNPDAILTAGGRAAMVANRVGFDARREWATAVGFDNKQEAAMALAEAAIIRQKMEKKQMANPTRRIVKVIIMDPNDNVPLDKCIIYNGEEKLTDLTDQELFFEIDIKGLLEKHNAERTKIADKKIKDRTEYLEPARVRDLKMVVVNVAEF